jgi:hypothetical protein
MILFFCRYSSAGPQNQVIFAVIPAFLPFERLTKSRIHLIMHVILDTIKGLPKPCAGSELQPVRTESRITAADDVASVGQ